MILLAKQEGFSILLDSMGEKEKEILLQHDHFEGRQIITLEYLGIQGVSLSSRNFLEFLQFNIFLLLSNIYLQPRFCNADQFQNILKEK